MKPNRYNTTDGTDTAAIIVAGLLAVVGFVTALATTAVVLWALIEVVLWLTR